MNLFNKYFALFTILLSLLTFNGCKDDCPKCDDPTNPECENYDPCWDKKPVTADFEMSDLFPIAPPDGIPEWNPDVVFARGRIGFKAKVDFEIFSDVKYTWLLGSEVINEPYFERLFNETQEGENNIPVTLIIEAEPNLACFPNDDGRDTIVKFIRFVNRPCEFATTGDFKVLFDGEQDSAIIRTRNWYAQGPLRAYEVLDTCYWGSMLCIGFNRDREQPDTIGNTFRYIRQLNSTLYVLDGQVNGTPSGKPLLQVDPNTNEVQGEYHIVPNEEKTFKFKGRKL
jgi:hypothetical protein